LWCQVIEKNDVFGLKRPEKTAHLGEYRFKSHP
jgi:hypothetical protein